METRSKAIPTCLCITGKIEFIEIIPVSVRIDFDETMSFERKYEAHVFNRIRIATRLLSALIVNLALTLGEVTCEYL